MHKRYFVICASFLLITAPFFSQAQQNATKLWLSETSQIRVHKKWSIHFDAQYRTFEITPNTEQLIARGGINYHLNSSSFASVGYAYAANFASDKEQYSAAQVTENRLWQQFLIRKPIGKCTIENRFRLEQRWIESKNKTQYLNRIRCLLRVNVPLIKNKAKENLLSLSFSDEVFFHFFPIKFDRNRLSGILLYQLNPQLIIQAGYMAQTTNTTTNHILQTGIAYNPDLRKK